ncbi:MAG: energy-coupling factor transporter transmembrane protein EcfT [Ruminococcus sp.]|nr:energy-coupling factor transporter transmembrane protein EcfT [Ruminococcus sp.]
MKNTFSQMHPIVNFVFFAFVISLSMFMLNPVCLVISLICGLLNAVYLNGKKAVRLSLLYLLPTIALISIVNPVFNHDGVTILTYFPWNNPLTLESIIYGVATAVLLSAVVLWFSCFNKVMTSDKFIYLFGRIIPSMSLILSMALRFIPKFISQFNVVRNTQKCIGRDISNGSPFQRLKHAAKIVSIMITWALENAIETADSMKSRGHGLKGRTAFSIYRFSKRDIITLVTIIIIGTSLVVMSMLKIAKFRYFPSVKGNVVSVTSIIYYILYFVLMLIPLIINVREGAKWKRLRLAI